MRTTKKLFQLQAFCGLIFIFQIDQVRGRFSKIYSHA